MNCKCDRFFFNKVRDKMNEIFEISFGDYVFVRFFKEIMAFQI